MSKSSVDKHSQGPWSYTGEEDGDFIIWASNEDCLGNVGGAFIQPVCDNAEDAKQMVAFDVEKANAQLMAASPELLDALSAMLVNYGNLHALYDLGDCQATEDARAAIAKARGEL